MNLHAKISFIKSIIRIGACVPILLGMNSGLMILAIGFLVAELLGVVEEIEELE